MRESVEEMAERLGIDLRWTRPIPSPGLFHYQEEAYPPRMVVDDIKAKRAIEILRMLSDAGYMPVVTGPMFIEMVEKVAAILDSLIEEIRRV